MFVKKYPSISMYNFMIVPEDNEIELCKKINPEAGNKIEQVFLQSYDVTELIEAINLLNDILMK